MNAFSLATSLKQIRKNFSLVKKKEEDEVKKKFFMTHQILYIIFLILNYRFLIKISKIILSLLLVLSSFWNVIFFLVNNKHLLLNIYYNGFLCFSCSFSRSLAHSKVKCACIKRILNFLCEIFSKINFFYSGIFISINFQQAHVIR